MPILAALTISTPTFKNPSALVSLMAARIQSGFQEMDCASWFLFYIPLPGEGGVQLAGWANLTEFSLAAMAAGARGKADKLFVLMFSYR